MGDFYTRWVCKQFKDAHSDVWDLGALTGPGHSNQRGEFLPYAEISDYQTTLVPHNDRLLPSNRDVSRDIIVPRLLQYLG